jgi:hypothetical protein
MVPDSAVISDQNQKVLYVVGPGDTVEARPVRLGAVLGKLRAIESGIDTGDRVIINGLMQARPGAKVNPQEGSISLESLPPVPDRPQLPDSTLDGAPEPAVKEESAP